MIVWRLFKIALVLAVLGGGGYALWRKGLSSLPGLAASGASGAETTPLGKVERRDLTLKVTVAGGIVPRRKALIAAPYNGYLRRVFVKVGDVVKTGDPIVSIAQAVGAPDEDVFPLRSPLAGRVEQVTRDVGEYVTQTPATGQDPFLVRIDDITHLYVVAAVPEIEIAKLEVGQMATIRSVAVPQRTYKGRIIEIAQAAKDQERWERAKVEFGVRVEILDPDASLKPGMSAILDVIIKEAKGVLALAHEYVGREGTTYFVTDAKGARHDIEVGLANEEAFEVKSGVTDGDQVRMVDFLAASAPSTTKAMR